MPYHAVSSDDDFIDDSDEVFEAISDNESVEETISRIHRRHRDRHMEEDELYSDHEAGGRDRERSIDTDPLFGGEDVEELRDEITIAGGSVAANRDRRGNPPYQRRPIIRARPEAGPSRSVNSLDRERIRVERERIRAAVAGAPPLLLARPRPRINLNEMDRRTRGFAPARGRDTTARPPRVLSPLGAERPHRRRPLVEVSESENSEPPVNRRNTRSVVDLTADSEDESEEEVVFMRSNNAPGDMAAGAQAGAQVGAALRVRFGSGNEGAEDRIGDHRVPNGLRARQAIQDLDHILEQGRRATEALLREEQARRREILSPPRHQYNGGDPRIRLGGALLRRGDQQYQYIPTRNADPGGESLVDRAVRRVEAARRRVVQEERAAELNNQLDQLDQRAGGGFAGLMGALGGRAYNGIENAWLNLNRYAGHYAADIGHVPGGPRLPPPDINNIIAGVPKFSIEALPNFTTQLDLDQHVTIEIDERENVIKPKKKPRLACLMCHDELRLSSNYRSDDDRVWTLKCGHLVDQKCLHQLSSPIGTEQANGIQGLPILGAAETRGRGKRAKTAKQIQPREHEWTCPVKGCGRGHKSVQMPGTEGWQQKAGEGALHVFM